MDHLKDIPPPELVEIPAGTFRFGATDNDRFANATERPTREVHVDAFFLARFPATDRSGLPLVGVSWHEATAIATGFSLRLPTEIEWEYAARAGAATVFSTGDTIDPAQANYLLDESGCRVGPGCRTPAATYAPNAFGLEAMEGNVLEWTADVWRPDHGINTVADPARRTVKGGAWDLLPRLLRPAWRDGVPAGRRQDNLGFRLAL